MTKTKEIPNINSDNPKTIKSDKPEPKFFEFGDVFFECNRCGNYERLNKGVKDGMQFVLPTSDQHEWRLVCGKCENMMRIFFKESDEDTVKEAKEKIKVQEDAEREKAKEEALEKAKKEDESKEKDTKEESTEGSDSDPERISESDGEGESPPAVTD